MVFHITFVLALFHDKKCCNCTNLFPYILCDLNVMSLVLSWWRSRKHGRGWEGAAPESDATRRETLRPTRDAASDAIDRASVPRLSFFFLFFSDSHRLARIGPYRPYRSISASGRYGRNRPKTAEIGLETRRKSRNYDLRCVSCLLLSLFCESSILMCFLRIF